MSLLQNTLLFFGSAGIIAWLIRSIIKSYLDKDLEAYKAKLKQETIRFSKLYGTRAEVIAKLYSKLANLKEDISMCYVKNSGKTNKEIILKANNRLSDVNKFYSENKLYFTKKQCMLVENMIISCRKVNFSESAKYLKSQGDDISTKEEENILDKNVTEEMIFGMIHPIMEQLEKDFREILGIE